MNTKTAPQVAPIGWRPRFTFGDRLRLVRRAYQDQLGERISQAEMADRLEVGGKAYASWESGYHVPGELWAVCLAVSAITGVDPVWLAGSELDPGGDEVPDLPVRRSRCIATGPLADTATEVATLARRAA